MINHFKPLINKIINKNLNNQELIGIKEIYSLLKTILELNNKDFYLDKDFIQLINILDSKIIYDSIIKYLIQAMKNLIFFYSFESDNKFLELDDQDFQLPQTKSGTIIQGKDGNERIISFDKPNKHVITHKFPEKNIIIKEIVYVKDDLTITREYLTQPMKELDDCLNLYTYDFAKIIQEIDENE